MVPRQPTLDTLSTSTGYVWFRDSQHSIRSQPPQGMCGSETANTRYALILHRVCVVPRQPTLDTLSASTGYVWFRDSQHSRRSHPPQGMCGSETANTRHALILHRVCVVPRQPTLDTLSASTGYVWFLDSLTLDALPASTGYVRCRDSQHSTRCDPPQGLCGSETANTRYALSLHRVCEVPRPPQSRHALSLLRVCEVPRPPQSRHALSLHRVLLRNYLSVVNRSFSYVFIVIIIIIIIIIIVVIIIIIIIILVT